MRLALIKSYTVYDVVYDIEEFNLDKPLAQQEIIERIKNEMKRIGNEEYGEMK